MRFAILSGGTGWHVQDLRRAADELGHSTEIVDFRRLKAGVGVCVDALATFDGILVRTMPAGSLEQVIFRMDLLNRLSATGTKVVNPPRVLETCVDKYLTTALLDHAGLRVPPTIVCQDADAARDAFGALGGDVVVKPLFGSEGRGMVRVSDPELAWRTFQTLERLGAILYLQQFIRHPGWDMRVFVLDGEVLGGMLRYGKGDWRTNVAQGGEARRVTPGPEESGLALRAAAAVGTIAAGVDLIRDSQADWYVLEVNAVPGWRAFAAVTGIDVAKAIIQNLAEEGKR